MKTPGAKQTRPKGNPSWLNLFKFSTVLGLIGIVLIATVHPGNLVLVRWGIFHCGSQTGEVPIPVNRDVNVSRVVLVHGGGINFQAARIFDHGGTLRGIGTWAVGDNVPAKSRGAVDALARKYSTKDSPIRERDHGSAVRAARTCAEDDLPPVSK